jgi:hypothetical protein
MQADETVNLPAKTITGSDRLFHDNGITDSAMTVSSVGRNRKSEMSCTSGSVPGKLSCQG